MKSIISKKTHSKKILTIFLVVSFLFVSCPKKTNAAWVPGVDPIINQAIRFLKENIMSAIVGGMKTAAINMINAQINIQIGKMGGSGGGTFVTNWKAHIITQSRNKANVYLNDYLSQSTQGRGNNASYKSEGYNYSEDLKYSATTKVTQSTSVPKPTYEGNPTQMTQGNDFLKKLGNYYSGVNPRDSYSSSANTFYEETYREEQKVISDATISNQGFAGTDKNGNITRPGILNKDMIANLENIGNITLANAKDLPEVIISAVVSKGLTMAMQKGFSSLQNKYQAKENVQIQSQYNANPGAKFR